MDNRRPWYRPHNRIFRTDYPEYPHDQNYTHDSNYNYDPNYSHDPNTRTAVLEKPRVQTTIPPTTIVEEIPSTTKPNNAYISRSERLAEKYRTLLKDFSLDGFQVIRKQFMSHAYDPCITIWDRGVRFNNSCISKLEEAVYVQFLIHPEKSLLAIRPCNEDDRDAVRWCITRDGERRTRDIKCKKLMELLYEHMGWERIYRFRIQGVKTPYKDGFAYVFDLSEPEAYLPQKRDPVTGKVIRPETILPEKWAGSFGMEVGEHSQKVDLDEEFAYTGEDNTPENKEPKNTTNPTTTTQ